MGLPLYICGSIVSKRQRKGVNDADAGRIYEERKEGEDKPENPAITTFIVMEAAARREINRR